MRLIPLHKIVFQKSKVKQKISMINDTFMSTFTGFQYGVENLKSIILMLAITDKRLTVEKAVQLARLETLYQVNKTRWIQ